MNGASPRNATHLNNARTLDPHAVSHRDAHDLIRQLANGAARQFEPRPPAAPDPSPRQGTPAHPSPAPLCR
ncbi:hypothetical protein [Streptomyces sp. NBC_00690]|uniref:hypothetical protein n=1 Tax=Streptomyces sp. NBC_00690 TaxID=2975808 RepID=UPI002E27B1CA|nr:hypothetical protein [Streptomyces sp. NBC_00690]